MRCHYEVLEVERSADDASLRVAYRKAALRWHPDKHPPDKQAEAAEHFQEIQAAYEVLTDKKERSWYDSHRDQILRSSGSWTPGADAPAARAPEDLPTLYPYFTATCYSGYGADSRGFYAVYGRVFSQVAAQEAAAAHALGRDDPPDPPFGGADTPWPEVAAFYRHFSEFVSLLSFAWADKHYPPSAPNRKVRRLMEAENERARKAAAREYGGSVRELAAFVRRRDKRVAQRQAAEAERALAAEAEAAERKQRELRERAERQARAREYEAAQWEAEEAERAARRGGRRSDSEGDDDGASGGAGPDNNGVLTPDLHCLACDKTFRTPNAFTNHERSKKHLERVAVLRAVLEEQGEQLEPDAAGSADERQSRPEENGRSSAGSSDSEGLSAGHESGSDEEQAAPQTAQPGRGAAKKKKKKKAQQRRQEAAAAAAAAAATELGPGGESVAPSDATQEAAGGSPGEKHEGGGDEEQSATTARPSEGAAGAASGKPVPQPGTPERELLSAGGAGSGGELDGVAEAERSPQGASEPPRGAAARKRASKTARAAAAAAAAAHSQKIAAAAEEGLGARQGRGKKGRKGAGGKGPPPPSPTTCLTCLEDLGSRNQLFKHIAATGHARPKGWDEFD